MDIQITAADLNAVMQAQQQEIAQLKAVNAALTRTCIELEAELTKERAGASQGSQAGNGQAALQDSGKGDRKSEGQQHLNGEGEVQRQSTQRRSARVEADEETRERVT